MSTEKFGNREVMPGPCDDCAFRDGSPERAQFAQWEYMLGMFRLGLPFFCHKGMPLNDKGEYVPITMESGVPRDARVCGGWMQCHKGEKPWPGAMHVLRSDVIDALEAGL